MLARVNAGVEQCPQFRALGLGLPLAKAVAVRKNTFFRAGLFLIAAGAADQCIKTEFFDGFQQGDRLVHIAGFARVRQTHGAARHGVLDAAHNQLSAQLLGTLVTKVGDLGKVVTGVDHQQGVGDAAGAEGFLGALEHDQGVFAAREQQGGALEDGSDFTQDEDGFFFQGVQMGVAELVNQPGFGAGIHAWASFLVSDVTCKPHSLAVSSSHHQRPARKSSPRLMARVQGAQPMLGKNSSCKGL